MARVRARMSAVLAGCLVLALVGCVAPVPESADSDPAPIFDGAAAATITNDGGDVAVGSVTVSVPPGSLGGSTIDVKIGSDVGEASTPYSDMVLAQPVQVNHKMELSGPLTISWAVEGLTPDQATSATIVRWNEDQGVWETSPEAVTTDGAVFSAQVQQFSIVDILFGGQASQSLGELFGQRTGAPKCSGSLPSWVRSTVDPDEGQPNAAILVCFEPDKRDEIVTVRVANNRSFSQIMTLTAGAQFAWTWAGEPTYDAAAAVWSAASLAVNNGQTILVSPGKQIAVGVARPATGADSYYAAEATVDWRSVTADLLTAGISNLSIGGTENPALNALLQVMYECMGGRVLLSGAGLDIANVVAVLTGCASEIDDPSSDFGMAFEKASRKLIAKGGLSETAAIQANRSVKTLVRWAKILNVAQAFFYLSDQIANAAVGPLSWGVFGQASPQELGVWTPTCTNVMLDSTRLYQNIALQDQFADTSVEFQDFPGWSDAGKLAVQPLSACSPEYRDRFARDFPPTWVNAIPAAEVLADIILTPEINASRWIISSHGVGPIALGSVEPDILPLIEGHATCIDAVGWGVSAVRSTSGGPIVGIDVQGSPGDDTPITNGGITLGSPEEALAALGATVEPWSKNLSSLIYSWFEDGVPFSALVDSGTVTSLGVGTFARYLDC